MFRDWDTFDTHAILRSQTIFCRSSQLSHPQLANRNPQPQHPHFLAQREPAARSIVPTPSCALALHDSVLRPPPVNVIATVVALQLLPPLLRHRQRCCRSLATMPPTRSAPTAVCHPLTQTNQITQHPPIFSAHLISVRFLLSFPIPGIAHWSEESLSRARTPFFSLGEHKSLQVINITGEAFDSSSTLPKRNPSEEERESMVTAATDKAEIWFIQTKNRRPPDSRPENNNQQIARGNKQQSTIQPIS